MGSNLPLEAIEVFGARYPESLSREPIDPLPVLVIPTQHFLDELGQGWRLLTIEDLHFFSLYAVGREAVAVMKLVVVLFDGVVPFGRGSLASVWASVPNNVRATLDGRVVPVVCPLDAIGTERIKVVGRLQQHRAARSHRTVETDIGPGISNAVLRMRHDRPLTKVVKATLHPPVVLPKQTGAMLSSHSDPQAG
jgi:hypothetical protein